MFSANFSPEDNSRLPAFLKYSAVAAATAGALYLAYSMTPSTTPVPTKGGMSRETLRQVITELLCEFHGVMVEMSQMAVRVRQVLALKGMSDQLTDEQLVEVLMTQGVQEKMEMAQKRVLNAKGLTEEEVEEAQQAYEDEDFVKLFAQGIDDMFKIAATGEMPILPGVEIPDALTPDLVLEIFNGILELKSSKFRSVITEFYATNPPESLKSSLPPQELADALQAANDTAEAEVLCMHAAQVRHKSVFNSAAAIYAKDEAFAKERKRQDRCHQAEIMKIMTQKNETTAFVKAEAPIAEGLHAKLQPVSEDTLPVVLMEAAETSVPVVVAMVKPEVTDISNTLQPLSEAIEANQFPESSVFTWMVATEESPITQNERCKQCPVVYVVFARPDVQRRPVACLSLEELRSALEELSG